MKELVSIDAFLRHRKEASEGREDLEYFSKRWDCTKGFISRVRVGEKQFGRKKSRAVFEDITAFNSRWTRDKYEDDWPEIHRRYLIRKQKIEAWATKKHEEGDKPPCNLCGDSARRHEAGTGKCRECVLGCEAYEPYVSRGRRPAAKKTGNLLRAVK